MLHVCKPKKKKKGPPEQILPVPSSHPYSNTRVLLYRGAKQLFRTLSADLPRVYPAFMQMDEAAFAFFVHRTLLTPHHLVSCCLAAWLPDKKVRHTCITPPAPTEVSNATLLRYNGLIRCVSNLLVLIPCGIFARARNARVGLLGSTPDSSRTNFEIKVRWLSRKSAM